MKKEFGRIQFRIVNALSMKYNSVFFSIYVFFTSSIINGRQYEQEFTLQGSKRKH